jgi:hypothetical protein
VLIVELEHFDDDDDDDDVDRVTSKCPKITS